MYSKSQQGSCQGSGLTAPLIISSSISALRILDYLIRSHFLGPWGLAQWIMLLTFPVYYFSSNYIDAQYERYFI